MRNHERAFFSKQFSRVNRMGMTFNGACNKRDKVSVRNSNIYTLLFIRERSTHFQLKKKWKCFSEKYLFKKHPSS